MSRRYSGIREIVKDKVYEINFQIDKIRKQYRIEALSLQDAYIKRADAIVDLSKLADKPKEQLYLTTDFDHAWTELQRGLLGDNIPKKTITRYRNSFDRMFKGFRIKKYPHIQYPRQLSLQFFTDYKNYYVIDLKRPNGLRAELIIVKAMMKRLFRLKLCTKELIEELKDIKKPKANKKNYPNICKSDMARLMAYMKSDRPDYYPPIYFISRVGRRISETTQIKKSDVIFHGLRPAAINIRAETTKMKENAPLDAIDDDLASVLKEAYIKSKNEWLFINKWGRQCTKDKVYEYLKRASRAVLGIALTPHYFRHRFFTECAKSRVPMTDAMKIAGLKTVDIALEYYSHSTDEGMAKVLEATRI